MGRFDTYFLMEEADALEYLREKYNFFPAGAELTCKEIGDGNLNYVFRIEDVKSGKSVILKHSGVETRAKSGRLIDTDRNRIEAEILMRQAKYAPGLVPEVFGYDPVMCCCAMEDLKAYAIMRTALLEYETFPRFADDITTYMVDILLPSTDVVLDHKDKKGMVRSYINPDLCQITEQLVYSEALGNFSGKNSTLPALAEFVQQEIYSDPALRLEGAKLKFEFMEHAQALLHGDLHSGSIFVTQTATKVFDPEFAFYGPMGYDLGNVIAHLLFALAHAESTLPAGSRRKAFRSWTLETVAKVMDSFALKFRQRFDALATDFLARTPGFADYYLGAVLSDAAGTAGLEIIRRIVGVAKVKDLTSIEGEASRVAWEKKLIHLAKSFVFRRDTLRAGADYLALLQNICWPEEQSDAR